MNKKGFTLVEMLGVIVILAIVMLIAIPNITGVIERSKKDGYINDAKKMVYLVKSEIKKGSINKPASGETVKVSLKDLLTNEVEKDKDGYIYDLEDSYVYITREEGEIKYYVQLVADKTEGKKENYRGILLLNVDELSEENKYAKYYENISVIEDITPQELDDSTRYEVGIAANNVETAASTVLIIYGSTADITIKPKTGYYLSKVTCSNGYTTNAKTGTSEIGTQTVTIANNNSNKPSTCTFTGSKISYTASIEVEDTTSSKDSVTLKYKGSASLDIEPDDGYYLSSVECSNGYSVNAVTGIKAQTRQTVTITHTGEAMSGTCKFESWPAYPRVSGTSNVWTSGSRTITMVNPTPASRVTRYEYYISNEKEELDQATVPTGSFTGGSIVISDTGKYIYFRVIYATGVISDWTDAGNLYIDREVLNPPTVVGGGTTLALSRTFILTNPTTTSGISKYEYYVSNSNTKPAANVSVTASLTSPSMTVTTKGTYIFFRVINQAGVVSDWTEAKNLYVDPTEYKITYNLNGGEQEPGAKTTYNVVTKVTLPSPTKYAYDFSGWYDNASLSGTAITSIPTGTQGNKTYYAKWNDTVYGIYYNLNGGSNPSDAVTSYTVNSETFSLPTPTKEGYTFNGWYATGDFNGSQITQIQKGTTGIKIFYAKWTANTYTVTLNNQSATTAGTTSITATYGSVLSSITVPKRAYKVTYNYNGNGSSNTTATATYTFGGYYTRTAGSGTQYINASGTGVESWNIASDTTLYAKWTSASVTLPTPTRTGYIFNGWYTAASGGTKVGAGGSEYTPTSAITLYAQWTRITSEMLEYSNSTYTTCTTVECAINELYQY